jgi:hypothetical protein
MFGFDGARVIWQIINLILLGVVIIIPIWLILKINSIDKSLKEILQKLEK